MRTRYFAMVVMVVFCCVLTIHTEASAGWLVGSSLTVEVQDSPLGTNFNQVVTLAPGMTTLDTGEMTVSQSIIPVSATSQWLTFDFEATAGTLLAGNSAAFWQIEVNGVQTSSPANVANLILDWTVNGVATSPIVPWSGYTTVETNPINPALGPVYVYSNATSGPGYTNSFWFANASPYSAISAGGMDPGAVNGFSMGLLEVNAVPEPSSLCSFAIGAVILGAIGLARRRPEDQTGTAR